MTPRRPSKTGCNIGVDTGDPALPVAGTGKLSGVRPSRHARWRAAVLITVHLVVVAHVTHFLLSGKTLSPVEPSESMYTIEVGEVNAGFLFFAAALLSTLVFGRFFCGWGCHLVALQDLCAWIMKRIGIRPRPFRARLLIWAPLLAALYMFVWPTVKRIFQGRPAPEFTNHLMTSGFWDTFPGPVFTVLTFLVCGFVAVYLLGAKGFCTYACPYGGFFAVFDKLSVGRILVNDDCEQCGHCTATCTSNVRVHEEVRLYGMVVDPGCMKCTDCISVCPKNALRFGFGWPSLGAKPMGGKPARRYPLTLGEELLVAGLGGVSFVIFWRLYAEVPLLMSICMGSVTGFIGLKLWQLVRKPTVRIQNIQAKIAGGLRTSGAVFVAVAVTWLAFTAHSGAVEWHRVWGRHHLARTEALRADVFSGRFRSREYSPAHYQAAEKSCRHFELSDRWGLFDVVETKLGLAWCYLLRGDTKAAETPIREAIALAPASPQLHENLYDLMLARQDLSGTIGALERKIAAGHGGGEEHFRLAGLLVESGDAERAIEHYRKSIELRPEVSETRFNFGGLLRRMARPEDAVTQLEKARELNPDDADTCIELGLAYNELGRVEQAIVELRRAIALNPDSPESRLHLPGVIEQLEQSIAGDPRE